MGGLSERPEQAERLRSIVAILAGELDEITACGVMIDALKQFGFALPRNGLELRLFARSALRQELANHVRPRRLSELLRDIEALINRSLTQPQELRRSVTLSGKPR